VSVRNDQRHGGRVEPLAGPLEIELHTAQLLPPAEREWNDAPRVGG
jgi:hypothetical protein